MQFTGLFSVSNQRPATDEAARHVDVVDCFNAHSIVSLLNTHKKKIKLFSSFSLKYVTHLLSNQFQLSFAQLARLRSSPASAGD